MNPESANRSELRDYDDAPGRRTGNPLIRVIRAAGAMLTVFLATTLGALVGLGIEVHPVVLLGGVIVSFASIPLIALFWLEEVAWRGGPLSRSTTLVAVSILTWFAETLFSAIMLIVFGNLVG